MSLDTVFEVWPNLLLALPTFLASDATSRSVRLDLPIERGSGTPRILLRRVRLLRAKPPATPARAAPTATAGPPALLAVFLSVPTTPSVFWLALLRPLLPPAGDLDLPPPCRPRAPPLPLLREPVLEREEALPRRDDADDLERAMLPGERDEPLRDVPPPERAEAFPLTLEAEPFDERPLLCLLPEAALLLAITHPSSVDSNPFKSLATRSAST